MTKGFNGPADNFLPVREPLTLPLDQDVVRKMTGFDFGSTEYINTHLTKILTSEDYQRTVRNAEKRGPIIPVQQTPEVEKKRGVFDFYKRRGSASKETLSAPSSEQVQYGEDPVNAYAPMISIYYLVREKMERERKEKNPGATAIVTETPLKLPDLPEPPKAYTNYHTHESAGEAPSGGRTRPRARTHGEEEVADSLQKMHLQTGTDGTQPPTPQIIMPAETPVKKESAAAGLLRRFSTRKKVDRATEYLEKPRLETIQSPVDNVPRKSFSMRRTRTNEKDGPPSSASLHVQGSQPALLTPPPQNDSGGFPKRFMSLRRSTSVDRRRLGKRGASEGQNTLEQPPPPGTSGSDASSYNGKKLPVSPGGDGTASPDDSGSRPSTSRAKSLGHARKESIQARRLKRAAAANQDHLNVPEETEADLAPAKEVHSNNDTDNETATVQPVVLKGLFSVSTTSSKPLTVIQKDLVRVMNAKNLEYEEIKGGFLCTHWPTWGEGVGSGKHNEVEKENLSPPPEGRTHKRRISFNALKGNSTDRDREEFLARQARSPRSPADTATDYETNPGVGGHSHDEGTDASDADNGHPSSRGPQKKSAYGRARNPGETSTHVREDVGELTPLKFEIFIVKIPIIGLHGIQFKKVEGNMMHYKNMAQEILKGLRL